MLGIATRNTAKLVREKSRTENVRLGRLFTKKDTASLVADMLSFDKTKEAYTVLDPGAGTGILSAAVIDAICRRAPDCKRIFLTCYETDPTFRELLIDNLERIRKKCKHDFDVKLYSTVYDASYLIDSKNHYTVTLAGQEEDLFDIIISNPPSYFVEKGSEEAEAVGGISQQKLSSAYLFATLASRHLEDEGQLAVILPTAVASAAALAPFRKEMKNTLSLMRVHLFVGKQKNESRAVPLGKNLILAYKKGERPESVEITTSTDSGKSLVRLSPVPYDFMVDSVDGSLTLPKSAEDTKIVKYISDFPETLESLGLKMHTGLVIDSRCEGFLFSEPVEGTLPLIRPSAIRGGAVAFPSPGKRQYIAPVKGAPIQKNKNMIVIKRVPAKSDPRFVNAGIYLAAQLPQHKYISTHNKINYIDTKDRDSEMCARLTYGLFALLNSTIYDRYISIISKSKQINSKELRSLPLPPRNIIENIGVRLMSTRLLTVEACDNVVNPTLHIIVK